MKLQLVKGSEVPVRPSREQTHDLVFSSLAHPWLWAASLKMRFAFHNFRGAHILSMLKCQKVRLTGHSREPDIVRPLYLFVCLFVCLFIIRYFLYIHFKCYSKSSLYPPSALLPYPPTPTSWPWHSPVLGHIKFEIPRDLSSQWLATRPSSATYAARDMSSGSTG